MRTQVRQGATEHLTSMLAYKSDCGRSEVPQGTTAWREVKNGNVSQDKKPRASVIVFIGQREVEGGQRHILGLDH